MKMSTILIFTILFGSALSFAEDHGHACKLTWYAAVDLGLDIDLSGTRYGKKSKRVAKTF